MRAFKVFRASKLREFVVFTVALDVLCGCSFVLRFSSLKEFMLLRFEGFEGVSVVLGLGNGYRDGFVDLGRLKEFGITFILRVLHLLVVRLMDKILQYLKDLKL